LTNGAHRRHGILVTTPQYYPYYRLDDVGALAISMYEMLTGRHPFLVDPVALASPQAAPDAVQPEAARLGRSVEKRLEAALRRGRGQYLAHLRTFAFPRTLAPMLPPGVEQWILAALGLRRTDAGLLHTGQRYTDWNEALRALRLVITN
jgi:hypothetical protein